MKDFSQSPLRTQRKNKIQTLDHVMRAHSFSKMFSAGAVLALLLTPLLANFLSQDSTPSPSPSVSPTGSPSPSPTPARTPSPTPLPGAQNFHQWGSITVFNGLPSDSVRAIAQTTDGVMWFGTDNGLARFDGRRIQNLSLGESEDAKSILAIEYDDKGVLVIGTRAGAFTYYRDKVTEIAGTESFAVTCILLWDHTYLGTDAGIVLRVRPNEYGQPMAEPMFPDPIRIGDGAPVSVTSLVTHDNGDILASTSGEGVFLVRAGVAEKFEHAPRTPFANTITRDRHAALWLGSDAPKDVSGLYMIAVDRPPIRVAAPTSKVLSLETNENGTWAGTERFGLFHIAGSKLKKNYTFENTSGGLRSNTIFTLFTDREGVLWIGTNRGVSRFDSQGASQEIVSAIPNSNFIRTLFQLGNGEIIFAGSNRGLFENTGENWTPVAAMRDRVIYAINSSSPITPSVLLVGTPDGAWDLNGRMLAPGDVRGLAHFQGRTFAAIYGRGVVDITDKTARLVFQHPTVTAVFGDTEKLLIGTNGNGLYGFDGKNTSIETDSNALKSGSIWKIYKAPDSESVWIAGQHGVFLIKDGKPEQIVAVEDVRDVWVTGFDVWAATTTRGLVHARRDDRFGWIANSISFEQGLPSEKAFSILPLFGKFYIATNRGIVTYTPGSVAPKLLPIRLLSQRVHDIQELGSTIALEYPQNSLLIEVAGQSSRTFPEEFQYAFALTNSLGQTVDRRISNEPQYAPTDLPPGEYRIEAIAFNRDLLPSEPMIISFSIGSAPFPWTATALAVLLLLALVGLIWAIVEHRRIAHRNRELAAARLDLANEAERERRRIARDLHDQTLADLRNLMIRSDKLVENNKEFRGEIEAVSTEIRRICEDLSPSVLENVGLVASLEFLLDRTIENRRFHADDGIEERIGFPLNVQLQIYRIAQEVLTNIDRHSDAHLVEMDVVLRDNDFVLTIRDDGASFRPDRPSANGRGISNIRARANLINGKAGWKELHGGGNVFSLRVGGNGS